MEIQVLGYFSIYHVPMYISDHLHVNLLMATLFILFMDTYGISHIYGTIVWLLVCISLNFYEFWFNNHVVATVWSIIVFQKYKASYMYCRVTNFWGYKISSISWILQNLILFVLEIVKLSNSIAYYLLIRENIFMKYPV